MRAEPHAAVFEIEILQSRAGYAVLRVTGRDRDIALAFGDEPGGHRWQRIPPSEKRDRVHTSTITVAVLAEPDDRELVIAERDLDWAYSRGSGAGGQHRNKTESAVDLTHLPTGIVVHCESERSRLQNRAIALAQLRARIFAEKRATEERHRAAERRAQVGSGMRGDKRRTIRCQEGVVVDHPTGKTMRLREYLRGEW
jgi:peptide chain release factor 1